AALALTEAVTLVADGGVPDEAYAQAAAQFDDTELAHVLALIMTINTWNRVAVTSAVVAAVRHVDTPYDQLLMSGIPRHEARRRIAAVVATRLGAWRAEVSEAG
ncbi:DUF2293 domain-containing protein, partial [Streptomyces sp. uw30]|uniref:DUF2293 domain-containing protein n=1 Tax=Streptomyces sp. uw30 TaxID=1828179 RepID=UPI0011CDD75D